jgi:hypothetical protein
MSPTARSLDYLRQRGYIVDVVERWIPHANIRKDLFGFADILAVHQLGKVFLLVQTTTASNMAGRLTKAKGRPELAIWLRAGGRFQVHGWHQDRDGRWQLRCVEVQGDDLAEVILSPARPRRGRKGERQRELFGTCR